MQQHKHNNKKSIEKINLEVNLIMRIFVILKENNK